MTIATHKSSFSTMSVLVIVSGYRDVQVEE
jgi:hypothetical protein